MSYSFATYVPIELTGNCNLKCKHCYGKFPKRYEHELSTQDIFDLIDELYLAGVFRIELGGGEPSLRDDFFEIIEYALKYKDIDLSIVSNGTLWKEEEIKKLSMINNVNLSIHISMDGYNEDTYSYLRQSKNTFNDVIKTTKLMLKYSINVRWNCAIGKKTYKYLNNIVKLAEELGIKMIRLMVLYDTGRAKENELGFTYSEFQDFMVDYIENLRFEKKVNISLALTQPFEYFVPLMEKGYTFEEISEKIHGAISCLQDNIYKKDSDLACVGGKMIGAINPMGNFYFCCMLTSVDEFACESVYNKSLSDIWNNNEMFKWIRELKLSDLNTDCYLCKYKDVCGGGCRARAYYASGDFLGPDPLCPFVKYVNKNINNIPKINIINKFDNGIRIKKSNTINTFDLNLNNKIYRIRKEEFGSSVFVYPGKYLTTNKLGYIILYMLYKGDNDSVICSKLAKLYGKAIDEVKNEVDKFIKGIQSI